MHKPVLTWLRSSFQVLQVLASSFGNNRVVPCLWAGADLQDLRKKGEDRKPSRSTLMWVSLFVCFVCLLFLRNNICIYFISQVSRFSWLSQCRSVEKYKFVPLNANRVDCSFSVYVKPSVKVQHEWRQNKKCMSAGPPTVISLPRVISWRFICILNCSGFSSAALFNLQYLCTNLISFKLGLLSYVNYSQHG